MTTESFHKSIADQLGLTLQSVRTVLELFEAGGTIPFIARYRKDKTGGLDEVAIEAIQTLARAQEEFNKRKQFILEPSKNKVNSPVNCEPE